MGSFLRKILLVGVCWFITYGLVTNTIDYLFKGDMTYIDSSGEVSGTQLLIQFWILEVGFGIIANAMFWWKMFTRWEKKGK